MFLSRFVFVSRCADLDGLEDSTPPDEPARTKLVKLADFKSRKNATKQGTWSTWPTFLRSFGGPRRLGATPRARQNEVGQAGQLQTPQKRYETGNLVNFPNFFCDRLVGLEDSTPSDEPARTKLVKLADFKPRKNATKQGSWSTFPTFFAIVWWASKTRRHPTFFFTNSTLPKLCQCCPSELPKLSHDGNVEQGL